MILFTHKYCKNVKNYAFLNCPSKQDEGGEERERRGSFAVCLAGALDRKTKGCCSSGVSMLQCNPGRRHHGLQKHYQSERPLLSSISWNITLTENFLFSFKIRWKSKAEQGAMWRGHTGWQGQGRKKGTRAEEVGKALTFQRKYSCHPSLSCSL